MVGGRHDAPGRVRAVGDAKYAVYGISKSGSDWQQYKVMELATKKTLPDTLDWVKVSGVAWQADGFYYSRYPRAGEGTEKAGDQRGPPRLLPQGRDAAVAGPLRSTRTPATRSASTRVETTEDERFALLTVSDRGKGKDGNALFARDLSTRRARVQPGGPDITNDRFGVVDNVGDKLLVETNHNAPNGRVVLSIPRKPDEANWKTILPESPSR